MTAAIGEVAHNASDSSQLADDARAMTVSATQAMSVLDEQLEIVRPLDADTVVLRWSMCPHFDYRAAARNYAPFDAIVDRDLEARQAIANVIDRATTAHTPTLVLVDDMAEGCAPATIIELAKDVATR